MSHFAQVIDNIVTTVIVAEQEFIDSIKTETDGEWIQTSYNTRGGVHYNQETGEPSVDQSKVLRKNYAGIGYNYDAIRDAFIPPKPFSSWVLDEQTCLWIAPTPYPTDDKVYRWDETTTQWIDITNP